MSEQPANTEFCNGVTTDVEKEFVEGSLTIITTSLISRQLRGTVGAEKPARSF
jgi:hypothetical protein